MKAIFISAGLFVGIGAFAQMPLSESLQLQRLIEQSEQQLRAVSELIHYSKEDAAALDKASKILEKLSSGINESIEKYQGTDVYGKALLQMQSEALKEDAAKSASSRAPRDPDPERLKKFQNKSLEANLLDLNEQKKLEGALRTAPQGFIPKLQTQAQIGTWQANTRVSIQLSELLGTIDELRTELKKRDQTTDSLTTIVQGSDLQNQRQREVMIHE
jgi:hypothetical protein